MGSFKPISISLSPNTKPDDVWRAFRLLWRPWEWKKGKAISTFEEEFKRYLGIDQAFSFNSGRSAFYAILKALQLQKGDEVLLQAFTCNAAVNPILWAKLEPVYVDCEEQTFTMDLLDLRRKISSKSKVLMVQHTFGFPAAMDEIMEVARKYNLVVIEDCAHALGAEYKGRKVGTFGKAAFFSFSRDKIISCVYGGAAVTNDFQVASRLKAFQEEIGHASRAWVAQQLLHPVLTNWIILPIYDFVNLGKIMLVFSQIVHILSKAVHWKEKRGKKPSYFPKRLPNALALLASHQLKKIDYFYAHRSQLNAFYYHAFKGSPFDIPEIQSPEFLASKQIKNSFLRFTLKHKNAHEIIWQAWHKQNILIGDWYTTPIAPYDTKLEAMRYRLGSCPNAEKLANQTFNLPTHINISQEDANRVVEFLKNTPIR